MSELPWIRGLHLLAAGTWTGGLIVMGALVVALRRANASREQLRAAARGFARVSWVAMAVAILTGIAQVEALGMAWSYGRLDAKLVLVLLAIVLAGGHQLTARRSSARTRGMIQVAILVVSLGIFAAAVSLRG